MWNTIDCCCLSLIEHFAALYHCAYTFLRQQICSGLWLATVGGHTLQTEFSK